MDLRTGYLLAGFPDFESAFAASEELCGSGFKVNYLNEAAHMRESEVIIYARSFVAADTKQYQNYHYPNMDYAKQHATDSIRTALEVLEAKTKDKVKFLMVLTPAKVSASSQQQVKIQKDSYVG